MRLAKCAHNAPCFVAARHTQQGYVAARSTPPSFTTVRGFRLAYEGEKGSGATILEQGTMAVSPAVVTRRCHEGMIR